MPELYDTLGLFAEISVAIAGFSGIVIAFGGRASGSLNMLEIRRLSNLFILSGTGLILSLVGVSLLHSEMVSPDALATWGSGLVFALATPWLIWDVVRVHRLEVAERAQVNTLLVIVFDSLAVILLLLQLVNCGWLQQQWPFLLSLVLIVAGAFQQFILLVRTGIRGGGAGNPPA